MLFLQKSIAVPVDIIPIVFELSNMNKADKLLLRHGFNLDGSPQKETKSKVETERQKKKIKRWREKKNLRTEILIANKKELHRLKFKKWALEDR